MVGEKLGNYLIERELGRGGMGIVYKAHEESLQRVVALKVLSPGLLQDEAYVQRFQREAQAGARLHHPNIVPIHAVGNIDGHYYISMAYVKGERLSDLIRREGQLSVDRALDIARQVADALAEAHKHDIVHRDIKPDNIMIDQAGRVQVLDFGLAHLMSSKSRLTADNSKLGTPHYMSPEQCQNGLLDGRTDLYALGVILFEMLAGRPPFTADSPMAIMYQITNEPFPPLQEFNSAVPPQVIKAVEGLTARDPADRFPNAAMVCEGLAQLQRNQNLSIATSGEPALQETESEGHGFVPDKPTRATAFPAKKLASGTMSLVVIIGIVFGISRIVPTGVEAPEIEAPVIEVAEESNYASEAERLMAQWPPLPAPPERVVRFPDKAIGGYGVRPWGSDQWGIDSYSALDGSKNYQDAVGSVTIPAGMELGLHIDGTKAEDFRGLDVLKPDDIQGFSFSNYEMKVGDLEHLAQFRQLVAIDLSGVDVPESEFAHLEDMHYIKSIQLDGARISAGSLKPLLEMPYLMVFTADQAQLTDGAMKYFANTTNLVHLHLWGNRVTDYGLRHIENNTRLRYASFFGNDLSNEGMRMFSGMNNLEHLELSFNGRITDTGIEHISKNSSLRRLMVESVPLSDEGMAFLTGLELTELGTSPNDRDWITDKAIDSFLEIETLEILRIRGTTISTSGIRRLSSLPRLRYLGFDGEDIVEGMIDALSSLPKLTHLHVSWTTPFPLALADDLSKLQRLTMLDLSATDIDDSYLDVLSRLTHLKILDLNLTKFTPEGIEELRKRLSSTNVRYSYRAEE